MAESGQPERYRVPAVVTAAAILDAVAAAPDGLTPAELVRALRLSKSSAHNQLGTLESLGWLRRDPRGRAYRLGAAVARLGARACEQADVVGLAAERAHELAGAHGVAVVVAAPVAGGTELEVRSVAHPGDAPAPLALGTRWPAGGPPEGAPAAAWIRGAAGEPRALLAALGPAQRLTRALEEALRAAAGEVAAECGGTADGARRGPSGAAGPDGQAVAPAGEGRS